MTKRKPLTARAIEALASDPVARREIPDGGVSGLYLIIQPSGAKSWALRYRADERSRKLTLGVWPALGLAEARRAAERALDTIAAGGDPAGEALRAKATAKAAHDPARDLVRTVAADFLARHAVNLRTCDGVRRTLDKDVLPKWGARRLQDIAKRDVIELLDGIVDRGAPVHANRVLACVRKLCNWAVSRDVLAVSPCAGVKPPSPETKRDRVLSDAELRLFWRATAAAGWPFGPLFRLLLLTGQRLSEVGEMTRGEVRGALWTIPAERAKNGKAHPLPLSVPALVTLASLPRIEGADYLFTTTGRTAVSGFTAAKARLDATMAELTRIDAAELGEEPDPIPHWTLHDLRRSCASGMARCGVAVHVIEKVLNHSSGSFAGVAGVYNRHSYAAEMRRALDLWGAHVLDLIDPDRGDNVVKLRGAM